MSPRLLVPALLAAAITAPAAAGPLSPPAGPVAPTHKTLTQVEPRTPISAQTTPGDASSVFVIAQPGSYYLAANLSVPAGKNGITIATADVTIDLNGFTIRGQGGSLAGITTAEAERITLTNGRVRDCGGAGVDLQAAQHSRLEDLLAVNCAGGGFLVGSSSKADRCTALGAGAHGFILDWNTVARGCTAENSAGDGFRMQGRCQLIGADARGNSASGVRCLGAANIVRQCTINDNDVAGISVAGDGSLIASNYASGNGGQGIPDAAGIIILSGTDNAVLDNILWTNSGGIYVLSAGNLVARNRLASTGSVASNNGNMIAPSVLGTEIWTNTNPDANYYY